MLRSEYADSEEPLITAPAPVQQQQQIQPTPARPEWTNEDGDQA